MKILFYGLNYAPEPVGIGKYSGELGAWLVGQGHEIKVITAPPYFPQWQAKGNRYRREEVEGALLWRCPLWVPNRPNGMTRLLHLGSFAFSSLPILMMQWRWKPDLIICIAPTLFCAPGALLLKQMCGDKTLSWLHIQDFELDAAFEMGILKGKYGRRGAERLERWLLGSFDRVSSISRAMLSRVIRKGVAPKRAKLIHNWVDVKLIYPQNEEEQRQNPYRTELGINNDELVLLYSGSISVKQGMGLLLDAIEILKNHKDLIWVIGAEGPGKDALIKATRKLSQVRHAVLQPSERLNDWLNMADIHLIPQEGAAADLVMPSKVLGAIASGKPMIATAPEGSSLGLLAEKGGRRVEPGDARGLANAVVDLAKNKVERLRVGCEARKIAEKYYAKNIILEDFEKEMSDGLKELKEKSGR